jgi:hypothetical protein
VNNDPHIESPRCGRTRRAARYGITALVLLCSVPLLAQQSRVYRDGRSWVEESSGTMTPARTLRVTSDCGNIHVQGGAQAIKYVIKKRSYAGSEAEARRQFDRYRINAGRSSDTATIDAKWSGGRTERFSTEMFVELPRDTDLVHLDTRGGNLTVNGTNARLELTTMGGHISADDVGGTRANTMGGNVTIGAVRGDTWVHSGGGNIQVGNSQGRVEVSTAGGNISVNSMASGTLQTGAGSIEIGQSRGDLSATTAGGSVEVNEVQGKATLQSGGGNIHLGSARGRVTANSGGGSIEMWKLWQGAQAQTGAGTITAEFVGGRGAFTDSLLRTSAGDVVVYLNGSVPCTIHASSELASGQGIRSEFPELKITSEGGTYGPRSVMADGAINGGGQILKIRTTIGQIEIRKAK